MVWHEAMGVFARASNGTPDITDPWPTKDVSLLKNPAHSPQN